MYFTTNQSKSGTNTSCTQPLSLKANIHATSINCGRSRVHTACVQCSSYDGQGRDLLSFLAVIIYDVKGCGWSRAISPLSFTRWVLMPAEGKDQSSVAWLGIYLPKYYCVWKPRAMRNLSYFHRSVTSWEQSKNLADYSNPSTRFMFVLFWEILYARTMRTKVHTLDFVWVKDSKSKGLEFFFFDYANTILLWVWRLSINIFSSLGFSIPWTFRLIIVVGVGGGAMKTIHISLILTKRSEESYSLF